MEGWRIGGWISRQQSRKREGGYRKLTTNYLSTREGIIKILVREPVGGREGRGVKIKVIFTQLKNY